MNVRLTDDDFLDVSRQEGHHAMRHTTETEKPKTRKKTYKARKLEERNNRPRRNDEEERMELGGRLRFVRGSRQGANDP